MRNGKSRKPVQEKREKGKGKTETLTDRGVRN